MEVDKHSETSSPKTATGAMTAGTADSLTSTMTHTGDNECFSFCVERSLYLLALGYSIIVLNKYSGKVDRGELMDEETSSRVRLMAAILNGAIGGKAARSEGDGCCKPPRSITGKRRGYTDRWGPVLVVCKAVHLICWEELLNTYCAQAPGRYPLQVTGYYGSEEDRAVIRQYWADPSGLYGPRAHSHIIVTHYDTLARDAKYLSAHVFQMIVLDEPWGLLCNNDPHVVRACSQVLNLRCRQRVLSCSSLRHRTTGAVPDISTVSSLLFPPIQTILQQGGGPNGSADGEDLCLKSKRFILRLLSALTAVSDERVGGDCLDQVMKSPQQLVHSLSWLEWFGVSLLSRDNAVEAAVEAGKMDEDSTTESSQANKNLKQLKTEDSAGGDGGTTPPAKGGGASEGLAEAKDYSNSSGDRSYGAREDAEAKCSLSEDHADSKVEPKFYYRFDALVQTTQYEDKQLSGELQISVSECASTPEDVDGPGTTSSRELNENRFFVRKRRRTGRGERDESGAAIFDRSNAVPENSLADGEDLSTDIGVDDDASHDPTCQSADVNSAEQGSTEGLSGKHKGNGSGSRPSSPLLRQFDDETEQPDPSLKTSSISSRGDRFAVTHVSYGRSRFLGTFCSRTDAEKALEAAKAQDWEALLEQGVEAATALRKKINIVRNTSQDFRDPATLAAFLSDDRYSSNMCAVTCCGILS